MNDHFVNNESNILTPAAEISSYYSNELMKIIEACGTELCNLFGDDKEFEKCLRSPLLWAIRLNL